MEIRGKFIKTEDILFYKCVASVAFDASKRISDEFTPTFIIEEALEYFSELEEYETCKIIKRFFVENPSFFITTTREEWFK